MATQRVGSLVLWLVLVAVAFGLSPPAAPDTNALLVKMMTGQLDGVNLSLFALFNLMGVFPMAFLALLAFDSPEQPVTKWPFVLGSFALGAFALLPYLVLRRWDLPRRAPSSWWLRLLASRGLAATLVALALGLVALFLFGDVGRFAHSFRTEQFPFVMSFDFVACCLAGVMLGREEARVRGQPVLAWLALVPALGVPLVALARRR
jgi:hypothetical protein